MKRLVSILIMVMCLTAPTMAQEGGIIIQESTWLTDTTTVLLWVVIALVIVMAASFIGVFVVVRGLIPKDTVIEILSHIIEQGETTIEIAQEKAATTETRLDDIAADGGELAIDKIKSWLQGKGYAIDETT